MDPIEDCVKEFDKLIYAIENPDSEQAMSRGGSSDYYKSMSRRVGESVNEVVLEGVRLNDTYPLR
jgi:hypothetical protein